MSESAYYLQQMGIDIWSLRQPPQVSDAIVDYATYALYLGEHCIGELWLEQGGAENKGKIDALLDAMLAAIGLAKTKQSTKETSYRILMGYTTMPALASANHFHIHHPLTLLTKPALKREAWQDLQSFRKKIDLLVQPRKD